MKSKIELENRCKVIKGGRDGREGPKLKRYWEFKILEVKEF